MSRAGSALFAAVLACALAACGGSRSPSGNDVVVTGSGPAGPVNTGSDVEFTMTVRNVGTNDATDIQLVNQLGGGMSNASISCVAGGGATCPSPADFKMAVPRLPTGGELRFTVRATVTAQTSGTSSNSMSATLADDVDRLSNSAIVTFPIVASSANLVVTGTGPTGTVAGGTDAEFVMTVRNDGPDAAANVRIVETVEGNLSLRGITCIAGGGATCPTTGIDMRLTTMPAGGTLEFRVTAAVPQISGTIANSMVATANNDRSTDDNRAIATGTAYTAQSGVYVTGTGPQATVAAGSQTTFTMTVGNAGPDAATDVRILNSLSAGLSLVGVSCSAGGGATCPASTGPVMTVPTLPANGTLVFTVTVGVPAGFSGAISDTLQATPSNDPNRDDNTAVASGTAAAAPDVQVTQTGAASAAVGTSTTFSAVVTNAGPSTATNVGISIATSGGGTAVISCAPAVNCPTTLGASMTLATLDVGRSLTFTIAVPVTSSPATVASTVTVTAAGDPEAANNSATASTAAVDAKNGVYTVYAADGREYSLTLDVDNRRYTMDGDGASAERSFTVDASSGDLVVSGNERLRLATDLVIGLHTFPRGAQPFVAARRFVTSIAAVGGSYNLMSRNLAADGSGPVTRAATARVSGNSFFVCQSDTAVDLTTSCDSPALKSYALTVTDGVFTATDLAGGPSYSFRVAQSGGTQVLLSTGASSIGDGTLQFRIGLPDAPCVVGGTLRGPAVTAAGATDWLSMVLTPTSYAVLGTTLNTQAGLQRQAATGPFSMLFGSRLGDARKIWVMQSLPLAVMVGYQTDGASGDLQITVP